MGEYTNNIIVVALNLVLSLVIHSLLWFALFYVLRIRNKRQKMLDVLKRINQNSEDCPITTSLLDRLVGSYNMGKRRIGRTTMRTAVPDEDVGDQYANLHALQRDNQEENAVDDLTSELESVLGEIENEDLATNLKKGIPKPNIHVPHKITKVKSVEPQYATLLYAAQSVGLRNHDVSMSRNSVGQAKESKPNDQPEIELEDTKSEESESEFLEALGPTKIEENKGPKFKNYGKPMKPDPNAKGKRLVSIVDSLKKQKPVEIRPTKQNEDLPSARDVSQPKRAKEENLQTTRPTPLQNPAPVKAEPEMDVSIVDSLATRHGFFDFLNTSSGNVTAQPAKASAQDSLQTNKDFFMR